MQHIGLTRRQFGLLASAVAAPYDGPALTAKQLVEHLKQNLGVAWRSPTVDTFKAGDPDTPVRGIATTFMATLDVLQRAAAAERNLIITHEPTFYSHQDEIAALGSDPVFAAKRDFIAANRLVVFRFHDHLHARQPDFMFDGLAADLGWTDRRAEDQRFYKLPASTLGELARHVQGRMTPRAMRVVGNPQLTVTRVAMSPGYTSFDAVQNLLARADVLIAGEMREWEGVEYTQDAVAAGMKKALILLGHQVSEEPGMRLCAEWLKTMFPKVPVDWVTTREPFWRP